MTTASLPDGVDPHTMPSSSLKQEPQTQPPTIDATPTAPPEPAVTGQPVYTPSQTDTTPSMSTETSPAPPQPGAVPVPAATGGVTEQSNNTNPATSSIPPPPKAGDVPQHPAPAPAAATATATASYSGYGYAQSQQSTAPIPQQQYQLPQQQQQQVPNSTTTPYASLYQPPATGQTQTQPQPLYYTPVSNDSAESGLFDDSEGSFFNTAKSWVQSAGNKLAEVEAEVWKRINDAHDK